MRGQVRRLFEKMKTFANVRNYYVNSWFRQRLRCLPHPLKQWRCWTGSSLPKQARGDPGVRPSAPLSPGDRVT